MACCSTFRIPEKLLKQHQQLAHFLQLQGFLLKYWYYLLAKIRRDNSMNGKCSLDKKELKIAEFSLKSVEGKPSVLGAQNLTS